ncbi:MAG: CoA transferase [Chloroflexi bacterium]|nr:CoA transferase [Chloroflexota bacterium]
MRLPLEGVRVVDLSHWWAGPFATMELAGMGAEVIKIEAIQRVDGYRGGHSATGERAWEKAPTFLSFNLGKQDITLDLSRPTGLELLRSLIRIADVVIDNYAARVMENFGLTYEAVRRENPAIIMVSMPGFGNSGPWRDYTGFAFNLEQLSGIAHHTGFPDSPPYNIGAGADPIMGMWGAYAVMTALEHRRRTGAGQRVDLAHLEALTSFLGGQVLDYQLNGRITTRTGNADPAASPHNFYPCKPALSGVEGGNDQWVGIAVYGDGDWRKLRRAMGEPSWAADERFADEMGRWRHQEEIDGRIAEWTRGHDKREAMQRLQEAGLTAGAALDARDLLDDAQVKGRDFFQRIERGHVGSLPYPRLPFRIDGKPVDWQAPAPTLGQHNELVLGELLALSKVDLGRLEGDRVIGREPLIRK